MIHIIHTANIDQNCAFKVAINSKNPIFDKYFHGFSSNQHQKYSIVLTKTYNYEIIEEIAGCYVCDIPQCAQNQTLKTDIERLEEVTLCKKSHGELMSSRLSNLMRKLLPILNQGCCNGTRHDSPKYISQENYHEFSNLIYTSGMAYCKIEYLSEKEDAECLNKNKLEYQRVTCLRQCQNRENDVVSQPNRQEINTQQFNQQQIASEVPQRENEVVSQPNRQEINTQQFNQQQIASEVPQTISDAESASQSANQNQQSASQWIGIICALIFVAFVIIALLVRSKSKNEISLPIE